MKIDELYGLWVYYSKENDFKILVAANDESTAEIKAYEYFDEAKIKVEHSIDYGIYCTIQNANINKDKVEKIYNEMLNIVNTDYIFTKLSVLTAYVG